MSALAVVISHVGQDIVRKPGFSPDHKLGQLGLFAKPIFRAEGYGHAAVVVFFVLSGFLVGGKLIGLAKNPEIERSWKRFLVDRFSRIFVVLWPALVLSGIVFLGLRTFASNAPFFHDGNWTFSLIEPIARDGSLNRWLASSVLLNELLTSTVLTNGLLWSLSYEWTYYIIGLAVVLLGRQVFTAGSIAIIGYGALLIALSLSNQFDVLFSGLIWVAGLLARVAFDKRIFTGRLTYILGIACVAGVLIIDHHHPLPDICFGAAIGFMIAHRKWESMQFGAGFADWGASFSYSLYLVHYPILLAIMGVLNAIGLLPRPIAAGVHGYILAILIIGFLILASRAFAWMTEDRTKTAKTAILNFVEGKRPVAVYPEP
jgi:peptidoglycan/LPS O-acetylase OafA/YrhL